MLSKSKRPEERNWAEMQDALDMGHPTSPGSLDDQDPLLFGDVDPSHRKSPSPLPSHPILMDRSSPTMGAPQLDPGGPLPMGDNYLPNDGTEMGLNDLELEILLRGNLLQQQQQRISILETSLTNTCNEIEKYRTQLQELENDKGSQPSKPAPKAQSRYWTAEEHHQFLVGLEKYGPRDVKSIAALVGTRNATQVRTHAQKYFLRVARENGEGGEENAEEKDTRKRQMAGGPMAGLVTGNSTNVNNNINDDPTRKLHDGQQGLVQKAEAPTFASTFESSMYDSGMGTDFDASLEINHHGGESEFAHQSMDAMGDMGKPSMNASGGPQLKRLKEMHTRSVSPNSIPQGEAVENNDLEEVNAESIAGLYELSQAAH